jgi:hypothetical protein
LSDLPAGHVYAKQACSGRNDCDCPADQAEKIYPRATCGISEHGYEADESAKKADENIEIII